MNTSLVSVIMPAYNGERFIKQAIESVLAQTYPNWELIIVDDGSTDNTVDIVCSYTDPRIRLICQENNGAASARNAALKKMQGEFLAFLDADDSYLPHHLESTVGYLSIHKQIDGVYTDGYHIDQNGNYLQTLSSRRRGPFEGNIFEEVMRSSDVFGPPVCVVLRTCLIDKYNLMFDDNITVCEDWDFLIRYADVAQFGYLDYISCLYRLHTSNISFRADVEKRNLEFAKCRLNAIKMKKFGNCSVDVRTSVFYDLLINLLINGPEQQFDIIRWPEFISLPSKEQAMLLRRMANATIIYGKDHTLVKYWLSSSLKLNPVDFRTLLTRVLYSIQPKLLIWFLKFRNSGQVHPETIRPFADMRVDNGN